MVNRMIHHSTNYIMLNNNKDNTLYNVVYLHAISNTN